MWEVGVIVGSVVFQLHVVVSEAETRPASLAASQASRVRVAVRTTRPGQALLPAIGLP